MQSVFVLFQAYIYKKCSWKISGHVLFLISALFVAILSAIAFFYNLFNYEHVRPRLRYAFSYLPAKIFTYVNEMLYGFLFSLMTNCARLLSILQNNIMRKVCFNKSSNSFLTENEAACYVVSWKSQQILWNWLSVVFYVLSRT